MFNKDKKNKIGKSWLFWAMLFFYVAKKLFGLRKNNRLKAVELNFKDFLHKENKEISEYTQGKEAFGEFAEDSSNIFKDYFVPHSGNNHMPRILRTRSLAAILLISLFLKFSLVGYLYFIFPNSSKADADTVKQVLELVNQDRQAQSLGALSLNQVLSASALEKANDIVSKNYFAHITPEGKKPWDFIDRGQYAYSIVGENLAMNFTTAESVHKALMNSPTHKHNIMNEKYQDIGLAMLSGELDGKKTNILVEFFAHRVEAAAPLVAISKEQAQTTPSVVTKKEEKNVEVLSLTNEAEIPVAQAPPVAETKQAAKIIEKKIEPKVAQESFLSQEDSKAKIVSPSKDVPEAPAVSDKNTMLKTENVSEANIEVLETEDEALPVETVETIRIFRHPGDEILEQNVERQTEIALEQKASYEESLPLFTSSIENSSDDNFLISERLIQIIQITIASILSLVVMSLLINIFVRFEIQHKPVLLRALLVIVFVSGLLFINFHYLESGTVLIYMS